MTNTVIHFYHNTVYGCGWSGAHPGANGAVHLAHLNRYTLNFGNNIIVSTAGPYISGWSDRVIPSSRARNLWHGAGAPPAWDATAISADPRFVAADKDDFRLQPNSPALDAGSDLGVTRDTDGIARPQGRAADLGAYEFEQDQPKAASSLRASPDSP